MKCTNRLFLSVVLLFAVFLNACGSVNIMIPYTLDSNVSAFSVTEHTEDIKIDSFASSLCVGNANVTKNTSVNMADATAAALFDVNNANIIYAKNIHERLAPASLTKVLTAVIALEQGNLDDIITVTKDVKITESGATLCGLKEGDTLTLNQALHALLINSANDAANAIAIHLGGSLEGFAALMNEKAKELGATNSHFVNPHGLSDDNHYTTAYDLYLIFNKAIEYELFREIIHMERYSTVYKDSSGKDKELSFSTTNLFLRNDYKSPDKVTVIGGKTGTTTAAGSCLIILSKDASGNPYISVILRSKERPLMYEQMIDLLEEIYN